MASDGFTIYIFDRESGVLTKRLTGLPNVINHLAFSKDGRFLVACLGGKDGIRLFRTSDYSQIDEELASLYHFYLTLFS